MNDCEIQSYDIECLIIPTYISIYNSTLLKEMYCCTKFWLNKYRIHSEFTFDQMIYSSEYLSNIFDHLSEDSLTKNKNRIEIKYEHQLSPTIRYLTDLSMLKSSSNNNNNDNNEKNGLNHHQNMVVIMNSTSLLNYIQSNRKLTYTRIRVDRRLNQSTINRLNHIQHRNPSILQYYIHHTIRDHNSNVHLNDDIMMYNKLLLKRKVAMSHLSSESFLIKMLPYGARKHFISKLTSNMIDTTANNSNNNNILSKINRKSILLTCFYVASNYNSDNNKDNDRYNNNTNQYDPPCLKFITKEECIPCIPINNNNNNNDDDDDAYNPDITDSYYDLLIQSKFIIILSTTCYDLTSSRSAWIVEAMLLHTIPILWNTSCIHDKEISNLFRLPTIIHKTNKLPMIKLTDILHYNDNDIDSNHMHNHNHHHHNTLQISSTRLVMIFEEITEHSPQLYTLSPLFFSFWLTHILPIAYITSHISRGISKHIQFVGEPHRNNHRITTTTTNAAVVHQGIINNHLKKNMNSNSYISKIIKHIHEPINYNNRKNNKICKDMKSSSINTKKDISITKVTTAKEDKNHQNINRTIPPYIEMVIPRCCETIDGDLIWANQLLSSFNHINYTNNRNRIPYLMISIYYKCPWCIPHSKSKVWIPYLLHTYHANKYSNHRINLTLPIDEEKEEVEGLRKISLKDSVRISSLIKMYGNNGIQILEDFRNVVNSKYLLREIPAFDLYTNGKEATAYLNHITQRYHSLAYHTMFLHTQPAHHLEFERFLRIFHYLHQCYHSLLPSTSSSSSSASSSNVVKSDTNIIDVDMIEEHAIDFMSLNYRWMKGTWAHQPEMCMMDVLEYLFRNSTQFGDPYRIGLPNNNKDIKQFHLIPMASGVAAQFITSRKSIQMRSLAWWENIYELNRGNIHLNHCQNPTFTSDFKRGSEIASVMERIWHNFFRNQENNKNSLYYPDIIDHFWLSDYLTIINNNEINNNNLNNIYNHNNHNIDGKKNSIITRQNFMNRNSNNNKYKNKHPLKQKTQKKY